MGFAENLHFYSLNSEDMYFPKIDMNDIYVSFRICKEAKKLLTAY